MDLKIANIEMKFLPKWRTKNDRGVLLWRTLLFSIYPGCEKCNPCKGLTRSLHLIHFFKILQLNVILARSCKKTPSWQDLTKTLILCKTRELRKELWKIFARNALLPRILQVTHFKREFFKENALSCKICKILLLKQGSPIKPVSNPPENDNIISFFIRTLNQSAHSEFVVNMLLMKKIKWMNLKWLKFQTNWNACGLAIALMGSFCLLFFSSISCQLYIWDNTLSQPNSCVGPGEQH